MLHFTPYAPAQGRVKGGGQYRDCTSGRTGLSFSRGLDAYNVPETAARGSSLADVVGYALGIGQPNILLVNSRRSSFPDSHLVATMDFPDGRIAILYTRAVGLVF